MGLADGQHNNLRDSLRANEINSQILKRPKARTRMYETQGSWEKSKI